jgi:hypothetical protein
MQIKQIDIICLQLLQTVPNTHVDILPLVPLIIHSFAFANLPATIIGCELRRNNHEVAVVALLHPPPNPFFRLLVLVVAGSIDEIAARVDEGVQQFEMIALYRWRP